MARRSKPNCKFVTGRGSVGDWIVNPWNSGLGRGESLEVGPATGRSEVDRNAQRGTPKRQLVRPYIHQPVVPFRKGKPYEMLLHVLEEIAALQARGILSPAQRAAWVAATPAAQRRDVAACLKRMKRLAALASTGRGGCVDLWAAHLGEREYPIHEVIHALLGECPPPVPFENWVITRLERPGAKRGE
jgi:hypothetical protein